MEEILHQLIWRIYHYLQGVIHLRWCRISSINSIKDPTHFSFPWFLKEGYPIIPPFCRSEGNFPQLFVIWFWQNFVWFRWSLNASWRKRSAQCCDLFLSSNSRFEKKYSRVPMFLYSIWLLFLVDFHCLLLEICLIPVFSGLAPFPVKVANEGLGWDPLLQI